MAELLASINWDTKILLFFIIYFYFLLLLLFIRYYIFFQDLLMVVYLAQLTKVNVSLNEKLTLLVGSTAGKDNH